MASLTKQLNAAKAELTKLKKEPKPSNLKSQEKELADLRVAIVQGKAREDLLREQCQQLQERLARCQSVQPMQHLSSPYMGSPYMGSPYMGSPYMGSPHWQPPTLPLPAAQEFAVQQERLTVKDKDLRKLEMDLAVANAKMSVFQAFAPYPGKFAV